jgi:mono/diheme cytochrome c family protein
MLSAVLGSACLVLGAEAGLLGAGAGVLNAEARALSATALSQPQEPPALPEAAGVEVVRSRCLGCHGADLIASQRLNEAGWGREIDKMVRWGATVADAERAPLTAYLAEHFKPGPVDTHAPAAQGEAVFKRACLSCHGVDIVEQQRLSRIGWTREVEKMMRWGAPLADADKSALVEHLASRYPIR